MLFFVADPTIKLAKCLIEVLIIHAVDDGIVISSLGHRRDGTTEHDAPDLARDLVSNFAKGML